MIVLPAMDLIGGRPVRLAQGDFGQATDYPLDPVEAVLAFEAAGAEWAHLVDLDGARARAPRQHGLLADIALSVTLKLQVAGGFREAAQLARMFDAGVDRVGIGSLAVHDPDMVRGFFRRFGGERIVLALDINLIGGVPTVATSGWTENSGLTLWDVASRFPDMRHLLVTDIGRDGMMSGPNAGLVAEIVRRLPDVLVQGSGGVSSLDDLRDLKAAGASGAIVGKALWEERIDLKAAIDAGA